MPRGRVDAVKTNARAVDFQRVAIDHGCGAGQRLGGRREGKKSESECEIPHRVRHFWAKPASKLASFNPVTFFE